MSHSITERIALEGFVPLGWLTPKDVSGVACVLLVGNAGSAMFNRFERDGGGVLDDWTRRVLTPLATELDARAVFPFDQPWPPFQAWARAACNSFSSPLGLNIHPKYGLWHAYRAAFLFDVDPRFPPAPASVSPCENCVERPCLTACPVSAFNGRNYDVAGCVNHLNSENRCMELGCLARLACPVGKDFSYGPKQMQFHMRAFKSAHGK